VTLPHFAISTTRSGSWILSDIQSDTPSFSGNAHFTLNTHLQAGAREAEYYLVFNTKYTSVTVQRSTKHIASGTIHFDVNATRMATNGTRTANGSFTMSADLAFTTDGKATLTIDGSHHYSVDVGTGTATKS
jgi:hypothetical protein